MKCKVYYEMWQLECCGTPFSVGDTVTWLVEKAQLVKMTIDVSDIAYCYEAHSSDWKNLYVLEGVVKQIDVLYHTYQRSKDDPRALVSVAEELVATEEARGYEEDLDEMVRAGGYVVILDDCSIRPARQDEVTFS